MAQAMPQTSPQQSQTQFSGNFSSADQFMQFLKQWMQMSQQDQSGMNTRAKRTLSALFGDNYAG